jgi:hypothetical protein
VIKHGEYRQAPVLNNFAFNQIEDLWDEPLDESNLDEEVVEEPARARANMPAACTASLKWTTPSPGITVYETI